jgi:hypothetical protein
VFLLSHFSGKSPTLEIQDPYGCPLISFESCYQLIRKSCDNLMAYLFPLQL